MIANCRAVLAGLLALMSVVTIATTPAFAQRGGGRGGGGGGVAVAIDAPSRLDLLETSFKLTSAQKKAIKAIFDEAYKSAAPVRDGLAKTHAALGAAVLANKAQAEVDAAARSYAEQASAMTAIEMKALAAAIETLTDEQRSNGAASTAMFFLVRGAFSGKKWNDPPDGRSY